MKKNRVAAAMILLAAVCGNVRAESVEKILYINKTAFQLASLPLAQIKLREQDFELKHDKILPQYREASKRLKELSSVQESQLPPELKKEKFDLSDTVAKYLKVLGPDLVQLDQETQEAQRKNELLYYRALKAIMDKTNADAVIPWPAAWYYVNGSCDATVPAIDEAANRPWSSMPKPDAVKLKRVYFVEQKRVADNLANSMTVNQEEFYKRFFQACSDVAKSRNADLVMEYSQSGYDALSSRFDLTDEVISNILKMSVRR